MKTRSLIPILLIALVAIFLSECKRGQLTAKKMTAGMMAYVYAYTSGTVSKEAPIRVRLTTPLVTVEKVGTQVESGVFSISPSQAGTAVWEDQQTIRFIPTKGFESGKTYLGRVELKKLFKTVTAGAETFEFDFKIKDQFFDVIVEGIHPQNANDMSIQDLVGHAIFTDVVDEKGMETIFSASQNGKKLAINWKHEGEKHEFVIKSVARGKAASAVNVEWNGNPIAIDIKGNKPPSSTRKTKNL
jgi:alpha-2-macroglobulin